MVDINATIISTHKKFKWKCRCSRKPKVYRRLCLNELQKEYCVKIKLIALDWQWVTLISWCQMNRLGHSSPVMHKVEGKTHNILEKLKIMSGKSTLFWHFFVKYFQITCVDIWISLNTNNNTPILHTCMTLYWSCLCSTTSHSVVKFVFLGCGSVKARNYSVKLVSLKVKLFRKIYFWPLLWQYRIYTKNLFN